MALRQPSKDTFFPAVLPKLDSPNNFTKLNNDFPSDFSPSPDVIGFMETKFNISSPVNGKKVHFSQPLEFWKEFDRDSGHLLEERAGNQEEHVQKENETNQAKVTNKSIECREKRHGKARVARTITEAVESLKLEDEKTSVRKFIAHYKRSTAQEYSLQTKLPTQRDIVSGFFSKEENNTIANDNITDSHRTDNTVSKYCNLCNVSINNPDCCSSFWIQRHKPRPSSLPALQRYGRKLFEERLLPATREHEFKDCAKYSCNGSSFRGGMPITPQIVQLFE